MKKERRKKGHYPKHDPVKTIKFPLKKKRAYIGNIEFIHLKGMKI